MGSTVGKPRTLQEDERPDEGLVMINPHRCIVCWYCMAACPHIVRFVSPPYNMTEKCDFSQRRIDRGLLPAWVEACPTNAVIFGDLNDPNPEIARLISTSAV